MIKVLERVQMPIEKERDMGCGSESERKVGCMLESTARRRVYVGSRSLSSGQRRKCLFMWKTGIDSVYCRSWDLFPISIVGKM